MGKRHIYKNGEIKDNGEAKGEFGDGEVDPLDRFQGSDAVICVLKEDVRTEDRGDDGPNSLNSLCDVDPELCIPRGASDCKDTMSEPGDRKGTGTDQPCMD